MGRRTKADILKKKIIESLEKTLGVVTSACKMVGCSRETFYKYYREDEEFAKNVDSVGDIALDFAETQLHENIKAKRETSIIFYLKTKGKSRGYIEKTEHDLTTKGESLNNELDFSKLTDEELQELERLYGKL